jgi:hypothetical protein
MLQCPVLFNGTNYHDLVPRTRLHMCGLRLWEFLTGELPCSPSPAQPVIMEKTTVAGKKMVIADYDDHLASYESQFRAYRTWLDEDAQTGLILAAIMQDWFSANIVEFERAHQMWTFLHDRFKPIGQSTFLAAIRREQILHQGGAIVDDFFAQLSVVWRQIDTLVP